jgi:hypothetical protein
MGVAKFIYFNKSKAHLTLHKGDEVMIIKDYGDGWSEGAIGSQRGLFPTEYVKKKEKKNRDFTYSMMLDKDQLDKIVELEDSNSSNAPEQTKNEDIEKMIKSFKTVENSTSGLSLIETKSQSGFNLIESKTTSGFNLIENKTQSGFNLIENNKVESEKDELIEKRSSKKINKTDAYQRFVSVTFSRFNFFISFFKIFIFPISFFFDNRLFFLKTLLSCK